MKSDVVFSADILEKIRKVSVKEFDNIFLCCVSLPGYCWLCGLNHTDNKLQTLQD